MKKLGVTQGILIGILATLVASCSSGGGNTDATADAKDATTDTQSDARTDTQSDARTDTQTDAGTDTQPDTAVDMQPDTGVDVQPEAGADAQMDMAPTDVPAMDTAVDMTTTDVPAMDASVDMTGTDAAVPTYLVGGTISGLLGGGLVLRNNGGDNLTISVGATSFPFTFATRVRTGGAYAVTVLTQPSSPTQVCTVTNGTGTVGSANVTNVTVTCVTQSFTVGGTIAGLTGTGLVIRNNGGDNLTVPANAAGFTFTTPVPSGGAYAVTVLTQPGSPTQICTVANGSGTVGGANVTNVAITCAAQAFTVGGTIAGLTGTGLVLRNNGGDNLTVAANATTFTFATTVATGAAYAVTVLTQPSSPAQTCTVASGTGTIASANVTNVAITCVTSYTVGGTITGLTGTGLVLQNNGGNNLTVASAATTFTFTTALAPAAAYAVTVLTQPSSPPQVCVVASGSGTIASANVTNVAITCTTRYTIGGTITGTVQGTGLTLQNNGGDTLSVSSGATSFTFATLLATGAAYAVTVTGSPTGQTCTVASGGTGNVAAANVASVVINCPPTYTIGGTITGLTGTGLVLRNNGGDNLTVAANATTFTFATRLLNAAAYAVTVFTQPTSPVLTCTVTMGSGTVASGNVTNVAIACAPGAPVPICALNPNDGTVVITENVISTVTCPGNTHITMVDFASFGQPTGTTCETIAVDATDPVCHAASSLAYVMSQCPVGAASCTVQASVANFGEPCSGDPKQLRVRVICQ